MTSASHDLNRLRGRPRQSEREVGRDKLIEQSRKIMNLRPRMDIQRREIAEIVGVTPALINYYFPDKWTLLEAAAYPFVTELVTNITSTLNSQSTDTIKFQEIVSIYLAFHEKSGFALYYYIISSKRLRKRENLSAIQSCRNEVYGLIKQIIPINAPPEQTVETVHAMLWSVCECLGHLPPRQRSPDLVDDTVSANVRAYRPLVLDLFSHGVLNLSSYPRFSARRSPARAASIA
jgi:AcrR family transcriptional regulator